PVEVGREIRTALHSAQGIDVDRAHAGAARLSDFAANVTRDLLEVVVGVCDHSASFSLEIQKLTDHLLKLASLFVFDQTFGVAILGVAVTTEIDAAAQLARAPHDRQELVEVVTLDDGVEPDTSDADLSHARDRANDLVAQSGNAPRSIVSL